MDFRVRTLWAALLIGGCAARPPADKGLARFEFVRLAMGVEAHVVLYASGRTQAEGAAQAAYARIEEIEQALSDYRVAGEPARVAAMAGLGWVSVSSDFLYAADAAKAVAAASNGAFDPTIAPCVQLWRRARRLGALPSSEELARARALVGWEKLQIDRDAGAVSLRLPGMALDFGGIGKGLGAHAALLRLREIGLPHAMVALAGDIACGDAPPGEPGWRILLGDGSPEPGRVLQIENCTISTSGDGEQNVILEGVAYAHLIDPRTGLGHRAPCTATVVAEQGALADAWASALSVGGPGLLPAMPTVREAVVRTPDGQLYRR
ncbi:MAG: FAD:protein FMN transferase [Planctomycetes bacterium]|nr:FAD:protein FMN transferase [Planctomycetota bacterium]